ncbi:hypothetical protein FOL47_001816 [Perkinsus chesapeaki]|uniref:Uncharacterized protein n=1 Tax=Perkinsus chesapeaki TaxID=330153 RepID=A0A7J6KQT7_PERCH|nr:hypothetical protein FOL47_001816 [Perkinsus chesapeaki]
MLTLPLAFLIYNTLTICRCLAEAKGDREVALYMFEQDIRYGYNFTMLEEMGVNRYIFLEGTVQPDGLFEVPPALTPSYTQGVAAQIGNNSTLLLAVNIFTFLDNNGSIAEFQRRAQQVINEFKFDGLLFVVSDWSRDLQGDEWTKVIEMVKATRLLNRSRTHPVIAPFVFRARNLTTSLWSDLEVHQPWLYADNAYAHLFSPDVDPKVEISRDWAVTVSSWYIKASARGCRLSLVVDAVARMRGSQTIRTYSDIIAAGGDPRGNGSFGGFYVNTPRQIEYKADLIYSSHLLGMALIWPSADLPPTDPRAMLQTMTSHLRPVAAAQSHKVIGVDQEPQLMT